VRNPSPETIGRVPRRARACRGGHFVFVVDDDTSIRDSLRRLITSVGFKVKVFSSARVFLSTHRPEAPGCLVLDVRMPGRSTYVAVPPHGNAANPPRASRRHYGTLPPAAPCSWAWFSQVSHARRSKGTSEKITEQCLRRLRASWRPDRVDVSPGEVALQEIATIEAAEQVLRYDLRPHVCVVDAGVVARCPKVVDREREREAFTIC
jgi:hypothetical protein